MDEPVASPCRNICRLSTEGTLCEGCGRTLDEIGRWQAAEEAERREIARAAAARLASFRPGR
ncbi:DUF1289 domain-containing protein [Pelagerythrobacter marensis]|uniref:DUF1289 domain-containing protein n=1 Tax=Pelagerythrobacter marensis TaxID=543877 RepID=UPI0009E4091E|nr:DUF1289 domain-containing protein [Pelagerythrobacter marensis]